MATQEEKDKAQKELKKIVSYFVAFSLIVSVLIFLFLLFDNDSNDSNCEIYFNSNQIPLEALMEKVKESDENCSKYIVYGEGMDKYGEKWEKQGYYVLTNFEWDEMRKYQDINFYLRSNEPPIFHPSR